MMDEILALTRDSSFEDVSAAAWSVVRQDLTDLSEPERVRVIEQCHLALGLDPRTGVVDRAWGERRVNGEKVTFLHPYIKVPGLRALANRFGEVRTSTESETVEGGTLKVSALAAIPGGHWARAEGSATEEEAARARRTQVDLASEQAVRRALWKLVRAPFPETPAPGGLAWAAPMASTTSGEGNDPAIAAVAAPAGQELPVPPPASSSSGAIQAPQAVSGPSESDAELASLEAMAPAPADLEAVEATNPLPPEWCLPERDRPGRRLPWPIGQGRVTSVGQMPPSPDQMREFQQLLAARGVEGNAIFTFTGRLHTHAETPLNPALLTSQEMARGIEQVRDLASDQEMKSLNEALAERGWMDGDRLYQRLETLVGATSDRDMQFVSSRTIGQALRVLENEPTLIQVHECQILLDRIGIKDPTLQASRIAEMVGRDEPVQPDKLSAKEIDAVIKTMRPTVASMKVKTNVRTNRQRLFPWSPDLK